MKSMRDLTTDFKTMKSKMQKLITDAPRIAGVEAVRVVKENFKLQGYDDGRGITRWEDRKASTNKSYDKRSGVKGSTFNSKNPLLKQTLTLYNSIRSKVNGKRIFVGINLDLVPYGRRHNEGLDKMPKRQFMPAPTDGKNIKITKAVKSKILYERDRIIKNFKK